ncbi:MAG: TIGR04283 family arsenosugar biosynthesis glycosyltransferase [Desulfitobacteriaceae bacterium]|jgi:rSAM/selenodomain-associated transferase 2|nr:TIGR04283 family arsenosugar biosynthesis glycosyltransferase [Desulfitobacteriaceae bacterium]NMA14582.1 glycosyltransferase family 2 protein [Clostridia bacterium]
MSKISVIIPTLNEEEQIPSLLESLLGIPAVEIVVSDGGSTDRTREICSSYPVTCVFGPPGRGQQLNLGARNAGGDIFFFLHADSKVESSVFKEIRWSVERGSRWGCCTLAFDDPSLRYQILAAVSHLRVKIISSCYGDQGIFCERELFFEAGGFPGFPFLEDLAFSRVLRRFQKSCSVPAKIVTSSRRFRKHGFWLTLYKMQLAKLLFSLGMSPERILEIYRGSAGGNL